MATRRAAVAAVVEIHARIGLRCVTSQLNGDSSGVGISVELGSSLLHAQLR